MTKNRNISILTVSYDHHQSNWKRTSRIPTDAATGIDVTQQQVPSDDDDRGPPDNMAAVTSMAGSAGYCAIVRHTADGPRVSFLTVSSESYLTIVYWRDWQVRINLNSVIHAGKLDPVSGEYSKNLVGTEFQVWKYFFKYQCVNYNRNVYWLDSDTLITIDGDETIVALQFDDGPEGSGTDAGILQINISPMVLVKGVQQFHLFDSYLRVLNFEGCIRQYKPVKLKKAKIDEMTGIDKVYNEPALMPAGSHHLPAVKEEWVYTTFAVTKDYAVVSMSRAKKDLKARMTRSENWLCLKTFTRNSSKCVWLELPVYLTKPLEVRETVMFDPKPVDSITILAKNRPLSRHFAMVTMACTWYFIVAIARKKLAIVHKMMPPHDDEVYPPKLSSMMAINDSYLLLTNRSRLMQISIKITNC